MAEVDGEEEEFQDAEEDVEVDRALQRLPPSQQMATELGLDTRRMQVMKASLFVEEDEKNKRQATWKPAGISRSKQHDGRGGIKLAGQFGPLSGRMTRGFDQSLHATQLYRPSESLGSRLHSREATPSELASPSVSSSPLRPQSAYLVVRERQADAQAVLLAPRRDLFCLVHPVRSLSAGRTKSLTDAGLFLSKSFRVGWGPNWTLAHWGIQLSPVPIPSPAVTVFNPLPAASVARHRQNLANEGLKFRVVIEQVHSVPWMRKGEEKRRLLTSSNKEVSQSSDNMYGYTFTCMYMYVCLDLCFDHIIDFSTLQRTVIYYSAHFYRMPFKCIHIHIHTCIWVIVASSPGHTSI